MPRDRGELLGVGERDFVLVGLGLFTSGELDDKVDFFGDIWLALVDEPGEVDSEGLSSRGSIRDSVEDLRIPGVRVNPRIPRGFSPVTGFAVAVTGFILATAIGSARCLTTGIFVDAAGSKGFAEGALDFPDEF